MYFQNKYLDSRNMPSSFFQLYLAFPLIYFKTNLQVPLKIFHNFILGEPRIFFFFFCLIHFLCPLFYHPKLLLFFWHYFFCRFFKVTKKKSPCLYKEELQLRGGSPYFEQSIPLPQLILQFIMSQKAGSIELLKIW